MDEKYKAHKKEQKVKKIFHCDSYWMAKQGVKAVLDEFCSLYIRSARLPGHGSGKKDSHVP